MLSNLSKLYCTICLICRTSYKARAGTGGATITGLIAQSKSWVRPRESFPPRPLFTFVSNYDYR